VTGALSVAAAASDSKRERRDQRILVVALHGVALVLLGLHLYVRTLPPTPDPIPASDSAEAAWWGLWPVTYLPVWAFVAGVLAVCVAVGFSWLRELTAPDALPAGEKSSGGRSLLWPLLLLSSVALTTAFFVFPIAHTRWGDAFILSKAIAFPDAALRLTRSWQAPLDVALHSQIWLWFHQPFGWQDAMPVYRLLSPLAGVLYLAVVLALSRRDSLGPSWLPYGLLTTLGLMQLFFGYVENYSFAAAGIVAYLWLGLVVLEGQRPLWLAAAVLAVTHATHPSTIVLAPSLLYLGVHCARRTRNQSPLFVVLQIALPMLVVGGATFAFMEWSGHGVAALLSTDRPGGGDARWLVPLFETTTRWERYTLLSGPHMRDWLNNQLLVAPVVLPSLIVVGIGWLARRWRRRRSEVDKQGTESTRTALALDRQPAGLEPADEVPSLRFMAVAATFYLLFTFVWNPDYGGQRDWDLFSLASLPTTLWLVLLLAQMLRNRALWGAVIPLIVLQAWHTLAWVYQNTLPWQWPD
jgi:hypothetical protein